jgi:hypothetical protein
MRLVLRRIDFEPVAAIDAAVETLSPDDADLYLDDVEPAGVPGGVCAVTAREVMMK